MPGQGQAVSGGGTIITSQPGPAGSPEDQDSGRQRLPSRLEAGDQPPQRQPAGPAAGDHGSDAL